MRENTMTSLIKRSGLARQTVYEARESLPTLAAKAIVDVTEPLHCAV